LIDFAKGQTYRCGRIDRAGSLHTRFASHLLFSLDNSELCRLTSALKLASTLLNNEKSSHYWMARQFGTENGRNGPELTQLLNGMS
jgi:hypothetical protein